jgi:predicted tellurium resistance membrane protein TerC
MDWLVPFVTLTAMEIVLGIDNIVFIAILVGKLPVEQQARARSLGLIGALVTRILLLLSITWVMGLTESVFQLTDLGIPESWVTEEAVATETHPATAHAPGHGDMNGISVKDIILLVGGTFLIWHSVKEIHDKVEGRPAVLDSPKGRASFNAVLFQIALFDIIFSLDSVITAVGMAKQIAVMIAAVIAAMLVMLVFAGKVSAFVDKHPTIKVLALSFLILIGVLLVAEGFGTGMNKGYIYFAMAFSLIVEVINMRIRPVGHAPAMSDD